MRQLLILTIAIFSLNSAAQTHGNQIQQSYAPAQAERTMGFSISPFQLALMSLDAKFLFKVSDRFAITTPFVIEYIPTNDVLRTKDVLFLSGGAGVRFQLSGRVLESGVFSELSMSYGYAQLTPNNWASFHSTFLRPTGLAGYSLVFGNGLSVNFALGAYYNHAFSEEAPVMKKAFLVAQGGSAALDYLGSSLGLTSGLGMTGEISIGLSW